MSRKHSALKVDINTKKRIFFAKEVFNISALQNQLFCSLLNVAVKLGIYVFATL